MPTIDELLKDPAWITAALAIGIAFIGLAILALYPISRD